MRQTAWLIAMEVGLATGGTALAGRPLAVDDADAVERGQCELEAGAAYEYDPGCRHWDFPLGATLGLGYRFEAGVGFGGQFEERVEGVETAATEVHESEGGLGDLVVGAKWQFLSESAWLPRQALAGAVKFPTADDEAGLGSGEVDYDLLWVASKAFGERWGGHVNAGYSWIGAPDGEDADGVIHGGVALDFQWLEALHAVAEVVAEEDLAEDAETVVQAAAGLRWTPCEGLTLDAAVGAPLRADEPDWSATVGATWAFGFGGEKSE